MVLQENQVQKYISKGELKTYLLLNKPEFRILNQQLKIFLAVNFRSGAELAHRYHAYAVISVNNSEGVKTWYYDHYAAKISRKFASEKIVHETEKARKEIQALFSRIKHDEYKRIFDILTFALGEARAKVLINSPHTDIMLKKAFNDYGPITTSEEREQLRNMGLEIVILEWIK